ncbi:MAG: insulinase family protein [Oscillospiraceae bacterium]|nr:insulinase family protein [Oscillospiraceae bacterium]MDD4412997.1 insulinase family protein [Oscillospiraceae bacterium]
MQPEIQSICDGAEFLNIKDDRFKTARLSVAMLLPLQEQMASSNAILPFLLRRSCSNYPNFTALQRRLNELYGARIIPNVIRIGNGQAMMLTAVSIDDRFALNNEEVAVRCAELLCSMIFQPVLHNGGFPQEDTEQEKRCLIELIQSEINEKRLYARQRCEQILFEGEGYAVNRYGTIEEVGRLTPQTIAEAWRNLLKTAKIRIIYQSAGNSQAVFKTFKSGLDTVGSRAPVLFNKAADWDSSKGAKEVVERMGVNQAKLVMGFRTVKTADIPSMRLMNSLLGGTPHSLLFKNVRERLGLCYYCSSSFDRLGKVILVDSGVDEQNAQKARQEILNQLDAVCRGEFTDEETESARRSQINRFRTFGDLQSSLADWYVGQSLDDKTVTPECSARELNSVTREDIINAARGVKYGGVYMLAGEEVDHVGN